MSRLDDELRVVFKRREPAADFAERVLARIAEAQKPKPTLWQRIVDFFSPAVRRWTVAAAALLLIVGLGTFQYQRSHRAGESASIGNKDNETQTAINDQAKVDPDAGGTKSVDEPSVAPDHSQPSIKPVHHHIIRRRALPQLNTEPGLSRNPDGEIATNKPRKSQGEIAKEQLYKALEITTNLLQEAKDLALTGGR